MNGAVARRCGIQAQQVTLEGELVVPEGAAGIVLFAHGSGSSRHSPRNNAVARALRAGGMGTLLFDLLTEDEDVGLGSRFDIRLLTARLLSATAWLEPDAASHGWSVGYFGASTGAAAALEAAAQMGPRIGAVVSRGGRPDLAPAALARVQAPTLLLVGESDEQVLQLNQWAYDRMTCEKKLVVVPRATHLFEERGALEMVAREATRWFARHLRKRAEPLGPRPNMTGLRGSPSHVSGGSRSRGSSPETPPTPPNETPSWPPEVPVPAPEIPQAPVEVPPARPLEVPEPHDP